MSQFVVTVQHYYGHGVEAARGLSVSWVTLTTATILQPGCLIAEVRAGNDLVIGNRFRGGIPKGAMPPLNRTLAIRH